MPVPGIWHQSRCLVAVLGLSCQVQGCELWVLAGPASAISGAAKGPEVAYLG